MNFKLPGGTKFRTPNNEKTVLVAKCGCLNMSKENATHLMTQFKIHLEQSFNPQEIDDTLVIIVIPSDEWDIQIYNPKSDEITKEYVDKLLKEYRENINDNA